MIGKTIPQDRIVNTTGRASDSSRRPGGVSRTCPSADPAPVAPNAAKAGSHRSSGKLRGFSIVLAVLLAMAGAASELGRGESVPPRMLAREPALSSEVGWASWYGHPYHGRKAANGERYDMNRLTAAHRSLPFGTRVRVHNLRDTRMVEVTITDRGPFVEGRLIDLSRAAAHLLGFQRAGLVRVRLEVLPGTAISGASD